MGCYFLSKPVVEEVKHSSDPPSLHKGGGFDFFKIDGNGQGV